MELKVATWNINSVRLRAGLVVRFLKQYQPDVLCLQEIKCLPEQFPEEPFRALGYEHIAINGQKAYHGVATLSRLPFADTKKKTFCGKDDARHVSVTVNDNVTVHNFYVPSGGDEPDTSKNEKFAHKLDFLSEMDTWFRNMRGKRASRLVLVGDLNVAPLENDVWSHKQLLKVVSHTPVEVEHLDRVQSAHKFIDVARTFVPDTEKLYSWWSYRARDWDLSDRGRRLDHIWVTPALEGSPKSLEIVREARGWEKASDHVPVITTLKV